MIQDRLDRMVASIAAAYIVRDGKFSYAKVFKEANALVDLVDNEVIIRANDDAEAVKK